MSVNLNDYREQLEKIAPELVHTLDSTFQDAARIMSPAGLQEYMEGAKGLAELGRGKELVIAFLEDIPQVVKECGEDVIRDCILSLIHI